MVPGPVITLPLPAVTRIDTLRQAHGAPRDDVVRAVAVAGRVDAAELGERRLVGQHRPEPSARCRRAASSARTLRGDAAHAMQRGDVGEAGDRSSVFCVGVSSLQRLAARERLGAAQPELLDHLGRRRAAPSAPTGTAAMKNRVSKRFARPSGRQPVAQVDQPVDGEPHPLGGAEVGDASLAAVQRAAPGPRRAAASLSRSTGAAGFVGEEQARFLEALADRGDPVVEAARAPAEPRARLGVVGADCRPACAALSAASTTPPGNTQAPLK